MMTGMRSVVLAALFGVAMPALVGCSERDATTAAPTPGQPQAGLETVPLTITQGQTVHRFTVELAKSESEQDYGMMYRTAVADDHGMLFPFPTPKMASFWMKNTLIPLDLIFIRKDGTIDRIAENAVPESLEPIASSGDVAAVLELGGGSAARLNIDESAVIRWQGDR